jgi:large subunit ribosomal protein L14e
MRQGLVLWRIKMIFEIGRLCVKIAGRDAGKKCIVVDSIDDNYVLIDGATRRRKCNVNHLMPLSQVIKIKKNASHSEIASEFKKLDLAVWDTKPKKAAERPRKKRKTSAELRQQKEVRVQTKEQTAKKKPKKEEVSKIEEAIKEAESIEQKIEKKAEAKPESAPKKASAKPASKSK